VDDVAVGYPNWSYVFSGAALFVSIGSLVVAIRAQRTMKDFQLRNARATALELFLACFAMRDKNVDDYNECMARCARLYAHLAANGGDVERARYVTSTACASFYKRDEANRTTRAAFEKARSEVEEHLRHAERPWTVPAAGVIHEWAKGGLGRPETLPPVWLLRA
jgi:hypothetical protein